MANWVRLWEDMPTDPKWRVIAKRAGRPIAEVMAVFMFMMTNAGANATERGELSNWSDEDVAAALDIDTEGVTAIREAMQGKTLDGDRLSGWEKRQPKREDGAAERAKQWRERNRTQPNAPKRSDAETDADAEKNTTTLNSNEFSGGGNATTTTTISNSEEKEIERRCVEAVGKEFDRGFDSIIELVRSGVDFEGRVLPMLRSLRDDKKMHSWRYAALIIADKYRSVPKPPPSRVFVSKGSDEWSAWEKFTGKRQPATQGPNGLGEGWWFPALYPPSRAEAAE